MFKTHLQQLTANARPQRIRIGLVSVMLAGLFTAGGALQVHAKSTLEVTIDVTAPAVPTGSPIEVAAGTAVTIQASTNLNVKPNLIKIIEQGSNKVIKTCNPASTGKVCAVNVVRQVSNAGTYTFVAQVVDKKGTLVQQSSSAIAVSWDVPLTISLSNDPASTDFNVGDSVTLSAQASKDVAENGFVIDIIDSTTQDLVVECTEGTTCTGSVTPDGPTTDTYVAEVLDGAGNIQAQSTSLTLSWS